MEDVKPLVIQDREHANNLRWKVSGPTISSWVGEHEDGFAIFQQSDHRKDRHQILCTDYQFYEIEIKYGDLIEKEPPKGV